jgi:nitrous-oxide reductase
MFASGGHSGNVYVYGLPSMRHIVTIPVFTPYPATGYGFDDETKAMLGDLTWGDLHHPALSETAGDYDGRWLFVNDMNGRVARIDLRDFKTKQIFDIPNIQTSHGGCFVTPNSEYVHISSMTPMPWTDSGHAPLSRYKEDFRGASTWLAINPDNGRFDLDRSFQIELPPYTQDLADAGKLTSFGFGFINSYNTEMAVGSAGQKDGQPLEAGSVANDFDLLHIIDWQKAEEVAKGSKATVRNGMTVIPLAVAIDEKILHFAPEPKNPHGVDVNPTGDYICVAGKLDPHSSVYDIENIKAAIEAQDYQGTDPYGVPILKLESVLVGQVELGAGPLHTQFDDKGYAYTSLFVDTAIAKWSLGPKAGHTDDAFQLVETLPVQYNIGHLVTAEGDTVNPNGTWMVALNKWSIDRFPPVGTLKPQNFQLVDLTGAQMKVLLDSPIGMGEPHYVQMIKADKLTHAMEVYEPGTDPETFTKSPVAIVAGEERIEGKPGGGDIDVYMSVLRSHYTPDYIPAKVGDTVHLHLTNVETTPDATHGFAIPGYNVEASIDPGEVVTIDLPLDRPGTFAMYCSEFCSALHLEMQGWLEVQP